MLPEAMCVENLSVEPVKIILCGDLAFNPGFTKVMSCPAALWLDYCLQIIKAELVKFVEVQYAIGTESCVCPFANADRLARRID